ncbi:MAG: ACP phosphodiesterase, partial [Planctomycetota bacterium]
PLRAGAAQQSTASRSRRLSTTKVADSRHEPYKHDDLEPAVVRGATMHRWVDRVTDSHPVAAATRQRLRLVHGRFAGILADVIYDHCLAAGFAAWGDTSLDDAIERYHAAIASTTDLAPAAARPGLRRLVAAGWMKSYADREGMRSILELMQMRFASRFGRDVRLGHAIDTYADQAEAIDGDFRSFFGELIGRADSEAAQWQPADSNAAQPPEAAA